MKKRRIFFLIFFACTALTAGPAVARPSWNEYQTAHFRIYYKEVPMDFVKTVAQSAQEYYDEITDNLGFARYGGWMFDRRVSIYIYNDREDYLTSAREARWSGGEASARQRVIRTFPSAYGFFDSVLPHEMGHIIFRQFIGFKSGDIPLWVDEGVAMYQEKAKRWGANRLVKQAVADGAFIPLSRLSRLNLTPATSRATVNLFYAEAASIIYYLIVEQGQYRFVHFCQLLRAGKPFEEALTTAYIRFSSLNDLNNAWVDYLKRQRY